MNPYKQRSIVVAAICLFALVIMLFSPQRDGFFAWFLVPGHISAMGFRWQCIYFLEQKERGILR